MQWCGCRDCHISRQVIIFLSENFNKVLATSPRDLEDHLVAFDMDWWNVWAIIWLWWGWTFGTCSIAVRFALKSEVDMLKMWVHERTTAENNPTNHYQSKFLYFAMITKTFKCNIGASCLITRHLSIWITNDCIHCSLPSQLPKLAKSGIWHCHLQCVLGHAWHTWYKKPIERGWVALYIIGHMQIFKSIDFKTVGLWIWITFFYTHCILSFGKSWLQMIFRPDVKKKKNCVVPQNEQFAY